MSNLLEIKNLKKYFSTPRGELHAVDNVNLNIEKGKTIGVIQWRRYCGYADERVQTKISDQYPDDLSRPVCIVGSAYECIAADRRTDQSQS